MDTEVRSKQRAGESHRRHGSASENGYAPDSGPGLKAKRLFSRRHAVISLMFWVTMLVVFTPLAMQFTSRIQSTLSGMKGTPSEKVRINVVKNFSTALAFPTAIVWDAKGLPPADADAAWKTTARRDSRRSAGQRCHRWQHDDRRLAAERLARRLCRGRRPRPTAGPKRSCPTCATTSPSFPFPARTSRGSPADRRCFLDLNLASTESLRSGEIDRAAGHVYHSAARLPLARRGAAAGHGRHARRRLHAGHPELLRHAVMRACRGLNRWA